MFPLVIRMMLFIYFLLIMARSITIVFLPIYFHTILHLEIDEIGYLLGGSLFLGTLLGIYGGHLIDIYNKKVIFSGAMGLSTTIFFLFPFINSIPTLFVFLIILNFSFCLIEIAIKAFISEYLQQKDRMRAFSVGYVLRNIAFTMGPLIGVFIGHYNQDYVFFASSILCFLILCILFSIKIENSYGGKRNDSNMFTFSRTLLTLGKDHRLMFFTIGSVLSAIVYGYFSAYLPQYLIVTTTADYAYEMIPYMTSTNAIIVILFQKITSSNIKYKHLMPWLISGSFFFILGLFGFMSSITLPIWILSMIIFSFGEIIVIPVEYMFVDEISPENMKGRYFAVQNLSNLGGALSPILCGILLQYTLPETMLWTLIFIVLFSMVFYYVGYYKIGSSRTLVPTSLSSSG